MVSICPRCKRITSGERICPKCGADTTKPPKQIEEADKEEIISAINQSLADNRYTDMIVYPKQKGNKDESQKIAHKKSAAPWVIAISSFVGALAIFSVVMLLSNKISVNNPNTTSRGDTILNFSVEGMPEEESKSPIDALNEQEREIYEAFISGVDVFKVPQTARILDVRKISNGSCLITTTSENPMGGTGKDECILYLGDRTDTFDRKIAAVGDFLVTKPEHTTEYEDVDVGNINRAIRQYWESLGID